MPRSDGATEGSARTQLDFTETTTVPHLDLVVSTLLGDRETKKRARAAELLGKLPVSKRSLASLRVALSDEATAVKEAAARALLALGDRAYQHELESMVRSADSEQASFALRTLTSMKSVMSVPSLLAAFRDAKGDSAKLLAEALGEMGDKLAVPLLCVALQHGFAAAEAAAALGRIGDERAIAALLHGLQSEDDDVRAEAARALGRIRPPHRRNVPTKQLEAEGKVTVTLRNALQDECRRVRINAAVALWQLGDRNYGRVALAELAV